jgi:DNA-binding LytR/AlgR family response regulator
MLNTIIIEDEKPAMELLERKLEKLSQVKVLARLSTVKDSLEYFMNYRKADVIFSDVQLSDGLAFEIFSQTGVQIPVIFITGYNDFMMMAFENNGIDYLLKPVDDTDLAKAIAKFRNLQSHFSHSLGNTPVDNLMKFIGGRKKTRLLVKKGTENIALRLEDVILFYTENKVTYVVDRFNKKYLSDKTLTELEEELDTNFFFRANRQYIININYVKGFKPFEKVKVQVDITIPESKHFIIVSQETAPAFRKWMYEA